MRRLLGLSVSFCVKDILAGRVQVEEVVEIIANTTGFVKVEKAFTQRLGDVECIVRGPNFDTAVDRYKETYWRNYPRDQVVELLDRLIELQLIREEPHGTPDPWIDTSKPWFWGKVSVGNRHGVIGTYVNASTGKVTRTPDDVKIKRGQE